MINADPGYGYRRHGYSRYGYPARHHYGKYHAYGKYRHPYGYYKKHHLVKPHPVPVPHHPEPVPVPHPEPVAVPAPEPVPAPAPVPAPVSVPAVTHSFEEQVGTIIRELPVQQFVVAEPQPVEPQPLPVVEPQPAVLAVQQPAVVQQVVSQETVPIGQVVVGEQTQIVDPALFAQPQPVFNAVAPEVQFAVPAALPAFPAVPSQPVVA